MSQRRKKHSVFQSLLAALAAFSLCASAHGASIVSDGGFESAGSNNIYSVGQFIGDGVWKVTAGDLYVESGDQYVYQGNNSLNLTYIDPYTNVSVAQTLTTVAGSRYAVSFWANSDSANILTVTENGVNLTAPFTVAQNGFTNPISNSSLFTQYTNLFTATSNSTVLNFTAIANPPLGSQVGSVLLDNVSVVATPEPASIALTLTGIAGLGLLVTRKRLIGSVLAA